MTNIATNKKIDNRAFDELEAAMIEVGHIIECDVKHHHTDGLYVREVFIPAGSLVTSKIHKTEHQFFLMSGSVSVWVDEGEEVEIKAPYVGITKPNTRRVVYVHKDCVWATAHPNPDNENEDQIEARIIEPHNNTLLSDNIKETIKAINSSDSITNKTR